MKSNRYLWGMLPLFVLAHFSHHLIMALVTPLLPYIRDDFGIDYTRAGVLVSACTIAYGLSQLPSGWLADRFGPRLLITVGVSGVAVAGLLLGLSPGYYSMVALLVLVGIVGGGYHPSASPLITAMAPARMQGRALGIHQVGGSASYFLAPIIAIAIASQFGWRGAFIGVAVPVIIIGLVMYFMMGRRQFVSLARKEADGDQLHSVVPAGGKRLVAFLVAGITLQVLVFAIISFMPLYLVDNFGTTGAAAGGFLSLIYFAGLLAGPAGGYLADRFGHVKVMLTVSVLCGPVIYLLSQTVVLWAAIGLLMMLGVFMFLSMPTVEVYIINHTPPQRRSTVLGIYYLCSRGGPGIIAILLGFLFDLYGFDAGFIVMSVLMVAATIVFGIVLLGKPGQAVVSS